MKYWIWAGACVALAACGGEEGAGNDSGDAAGGLDAETQAQVDQTEQDIDGYESWNQVTDATGILATPNGPHGEFVQIWFNQSAYDTVQAAGGADMPDGAIIVKQGYNDEAGTDKAFLTVMSKEEGEWFWVAWNPSGDVAQAGQPAYCTDCHDAGQDSVLITTW